MNKFIKNILSDIELYEHFKSVLTFHSSCIEGSKISEEDNTKLVNNPSQKTISFEMEKYKKDEVIENKNLGDVFDDLIRNYMNDFSIEELKQWHLLLKKDTDWSTLYKNAIGKFRITNVDVGDSENFAIDWTLINEQMINLVNDLNYKREFSIDDIAEFHCRFEKIHPFQDGNGRIGRMIILKQCIKNNISLFFVNKNTREEYINCLRMYHKTLSPLFLSEYFKKQQVIFIERYYKFLYDVNKYASKIIDYIGLNKFINRIQVEKILDVKKSTAGNILKSMVDKKIIKKIGDSSNTEYTF